MTSPSPRPASAEATLRDWLAHLRDALRPITDEHALEAELLARHVTGLDRAGLYARAEQPLTAAQADVLRAMLARRLQREPLPYILGEWAFCGLTLAVTPATLIPRVETEALVEAALAWRRRQGTGAPMRIADVGTGSGCIALALAAALPHDHVVATDVSAAALRVAVANTARHGLRGRVAVTQGDLAAHLAAPVDLIVGNLPYIADDAIAALQPEVALHEPRAALAAGRDGLACMRRLLAQAPSVLAPGGAVMLEFDPPQRAALTAAARAALPQARVAVLRDLSGADRVLVADCAPEATA